MDDCCSRKSETLNLLAQGEQRRVLVIVMIVNIAMFMAEFGAGVVAQSSALMADSMDMLGDA
ncbi:Co/Zn/Cd efflux system component [Sphingobium sp. OAS761]|nr:Co/Zn/Cd efflux system component [Sphingobium sp. OAS761]